MGRRFFWGGLVLFIGFVMLLEAAGLISGNIWRFFWAFLLILIGVSILFPDKN